jgi:fatty-acyl-CoA synthase
LPRARRNLTDSSASGTPVAAQAARGGRGFAERDPWPARTAVTRTGLDPLVFLRRSATLHPDRTAVVHGDLRRTYGKLDARVNHLASALRARGLQRRDRVAVVSSNTRAARGARRRARRRRRPRRDQRAAERARGPRDPRALRGPGPARRRRARAGGRRPAAGPHDDSDRRHGGPDDPYEQLLAEGDPVAPPRALADEEDPIAINYTR